MASFVPVNIPIELFGMFIAMFAVMIGIGIAKRLGVAVLTAGIFIMVLGLLTANIIMGQQVSTSTTSGSTTTDTYNTVLFQFTQWHQVLFVLFGALLMLVGALIRGQSK